MRYYKGYIALSDACDVPIMLHIRNARAIYFDQLCELIFDRIAAAPRSVRWRVSRIEKAGLLRGSEDSGTSADRCSESRSRGWHFSNRAGIICFRCRARQTKSSIPRKSHMRSNW